jgi:predicted nucleic acid-binding protein
MDRDARVSEHAARAAHGPSSHRRIHETGLKLAERYGFSTYDAMIAASALHAGCDTLWSEDMQHGMALAEGLRIVNPFQA